MSIQSQLIKLIISLITIATFIAALHGYRNSQAQLNAILDDELQTLATFIISHQGSHSDVFIDNSQALSHKAYQVFNNKAELLSRSANAPEERITNTIGFSEQAFSGARWRTYVIERNNKYVIVAQSDHYRRHATEDILLGTIVPVVFSIPFIGLLVFYIIRKSLSPLRDLSFQLINKHSEDLTGVAMKQASKELNPVVNRLNDLFKRLESSFELEKQLSANAAHELRTPISVLSIAANNLITEFDNGSLTKEHFTALNHNVERMAQVIEQIIGLFRFSSNTIESKKSHVNIQSILQEVISNNYLSIENENQNITLEAIDTNVFASEFALYVLFENLVKNASKYGGKGCDIHIVITPQHQGVEIHVHDSGKGITTSEMLQLTKRFYRAKNQTKIKGSGLGLAISQHIVNLHHGSLSFLKSPYGGLQVTVLLPNESVHVT